MQVHILLRVLKPGSRHPSLPVGSISKQSRALNNFRGVRKVGWYSGELCFCLWRFATCLSCCVLSISPYGSVARTKHRTADTGLFILNHLRCSDSQKLFWAGRRYEQWLPTPCKRGMRYCIALIVHESVEREMFDRNLEDLVKCGLQCLHQ